MHAQVDSSRYWFNYRHAVNVLSMYHAVRDLGIPDERIIVMLAEVPACSPRNLFPGEIFGDESHSKNLMTPDVVVDYRGTEVSAQSLADVLAGHVSKGRSKNQVLASDNESNVLLYLTGHGGDQFLKFHDGDEFSSFNLGNTLREMHLRGRYKELLLVADTCQAASLADHITAPGVLILTSSLRGENSYAMRGDVDLGISLIDRFTDTAVRFLRKHEAHSLRNIPFQRFARSFNPSHLRSHATVQRSSFPRDLSTMPVGEFFAPRRGKVSPILVNPGGLLAKATTTTQLETFETEASESTRTRSHRDRIDASRESPSAPAAPSGMPAVFIGSGDRHRAASILDHDVWTLTMEGGAALDDDGRNSRLLFFVLAFLGLLPLLTCLVVVLCL